VSSAQAGGGSLIGLIAIFSSCYHINIGSHNFKFNRQWGIWIIASSLAVASVVTAGFCEAVAELASGSRLREKNRKIREANETAEERGT
jgi:hypothetical protein